MNISYNLIDGRKKERNFPETGTDAAFPLLFSSVYIIYVKKRFPSLYNIEHLLIFI